MALFKIYKGLSGSLKDKNNQNLDQLTHEGYCYFTTDDGKFYIDIVDKATPITPSENQGKLEGVTRMPINSYRSDWAVRSYADAAGNTIDGYYAHNLVLNDRTLKLIAPDSTELSTINIPAVKLTGDITGTMADNTWTISTSLSDSSVKTKHIADAAVTNAKLANSSITISTKKINLGETATLADLGLNAALRFIGKTTTTIVDGATTTPVTVNGSVVTPTIGDVVINSNNNQEYVWLGSNWELLGDESSFALADHTHKYASSSTVGGPADSANKLNTNAGSTVRPVYFNSGVPKECVNNFVFYEEINEIENPNGSSMFVNKTGDIMEGSLTAPEFIGNLTGNADTASGLSESRQIQLTGAITGSAAFDGTGDLTIQTKVDHTHEYLPLSGGRVEGYISTKQLGIVNETAQYTGLDFLGNGNLEFQIIPDSTSSLNRFRYTDLNTNAYVEYQLGERQTSIQNTEAHVILHSNNFNTYAPTLTGDGASGTWGINISGNAATATKLTNARIIQTNLASTATSSFDGTTDITPGVTGILPIANGGTGASTREQAALYMLGANTKNTDFNTIKATGIYWTQIASCTNTPYGDNISGRYGYLEVFNPWTSVDAKQGPIQRWTEYSSSKCWIRMYINEAWTSWKKIWVEGDSVTGAIWNDYAEYRESNCEDFGYVLMENGDDTLIKTTERLSHFAGISSDTWGFSQGKTDKAKTPIAVAGRVLVYPYQDRNNYKPGDCVCAAPGGTVDIMTREEIKEWPDRIVGTVSCVPNYEEWGGGENSDRKSVKINGRIWIKVR